MTSTVARIPLNTFAIGFGLAGLAEVWSIAGTSLGLPAILAQLFWIVAAGAWIWLLVAHAVRGARSNDSIVDQLRHPAQGPIAALIPITGMLMAGDLITVLRPVGVALFLISVTVAALFASWLIGTWLQGGLTLEAVHGGYLLPTVAAGFVGAEVAAGSSLPLLAWGLFGVGTFFWLVMTVLLVIRLAFRPSLPDPLVPTMAILVAPPAVAGLAWFAMEGVQASVGAATLAGMGVLLVLVQFALVPKYRLIAFSLGFWSFTFPAAAVIADAMIWVRISEFSGWMIVTTVLLVVATVLVAAIGAKSLVTVFPRPRQQQAEMVLTRADELDEEVDAPLSDADVS